MLPRTSVCVEENKKYFPRCYAVLSPSDNPPQTRGFPAPSRFDRAQFCGMHNGFGFPTAGSATTETAGRSLVAFLDKRRWEPPLCSRLLPDRGAFAGDLEEPAEPALVDKRVTEYRMHLVNAG
jgi:hypothetical protein